MRLPKRLLPPPLSRLRCNWWRRRLRHQMLLCLEVHGVLRLLHHHHVWRPREHHARVLRHAAEVRRMCSQRHLSWKARGFASHGVARLSRCLCQRHGWLVRHHHVALHLLSWLRGTPHHGSSSHNAKKTLALKAPRETAAYIPVANTA